MTTAAARRTAVFIPCADPGCAQPTALLRREACGLVLIIESKHHGRKHVTRLTVDELHRMLDIGCPNPRVGLEPERP